MQTDTEEIEIGTVHDVSRISKIPVATLNDLRARTPERSPNFYRVGRRIYYPLNGPKGLRAWIEEKIAKETAR